MLPRSARVAWPAGTVFIPVATPGIGAAGHLFRADGVVLMPLQAARPDALPGVAEIASRIARALPVPATAAHAGVAA